MLRIPTALILSLLVLPVLIAPHPARADSAKFDYVDKTLSNGLRVVTLEDPSTPIVAVQVWYHVGSKNEDPKRQGFAHMFEHMMFRGTDKLGPKEHFSLIKQVGGDCNAYTAFDQTVYINKLPSNQLELALWLESERMAFLKIDTTSFDTERAVVEEERRLGLNAPYGTVAEKILPHIFTKHPYRWLPIGQIPHLRSANIDELNQFWQTYYVPNNATLVIVGAIKNDDAQKLAEKYFTWIPAGEKPPRVEEFEPPQKERREVSISEPKGPVTIVGLAYRALAMADPDRPAMEVASQVLGGGESSRIYQELVKKQDISVGAGADTFALEMDGLAGAYAVVKPTGDKQKVLDALAAQVEKLRTDPPNAEELEKAKTILLKQQVMQARTIENKAQLLGSYAVIYNDLPRINKRFDEIRAVSADDVKRVVAKYFVPERLTQVTIEPSMGEMLKSFFKKPDDEGAAPATKSTENRVAQRTGPKAKAVRPSDFPTTAPVQPVLAEFPQPKKDESSLPNGMKVVVIPDHRLPLVTMQLGLKQGAWIEPKDKAGAASLAATAITQGTENYDAKTLATDLEEHGISLGGSIGIDAGSVTANCLTEQADRAMKLLAEVVRRPTFPKKDFDQVRGQTESGLSVSEQSPSYLADRETRKKVFADHPYGRQASGDLKDVKQRTADESKAWWQTNVRPDTTVLYIAGDVSPEQGRKLAEQYFADWKPTGDAPKQEAPYLPVKTKTQIYLVDKPGSVQSEIRVGQVAMKRDDPDYPPSRVLTQIFGGSFDSRLNESLRVKKGLTYGASGWFSADHFAGTFNVSTFSKTPSTAEAVKGILEEIDKLKTDPVTEKELSTSKNFLIGSFAGQRETPESVINDLWLIEYCGLPTDYFQASLKRISTTTDQDVKRVAAERIDPNQLVIVVVGDAKKIKDDLAKIAPLTEVKESPTTQPATK